MSDHYTIKLADGKYTIIHWQQGHGGRNELEFLRHDEPWPAADDLKHSGVVLAMHQRIEELEMAIGDVLNGSRDGWGRRQPDGIRNNVCDLEMTITCWEAKLRNVLEQT